MSDDQKDKEKKAEIARQHKRLFHILQGEAWVETHRSVPVAYNAAEAIALIRGPMFDAYSYDAANMARWILESGRAELRAPLFERLANDPDSDMYLSLSCAYAKPGTLNLFEAIAQNVGIRDAGELVRRARNHGRKEDARIIRMVEKTVHPVLYHPYLAPVVRMVRDVAGAVMELGRQNKSGFMNRFGYEQSGRTPDEKLNDLSSRWLVSGGFLFSLMGTFLGWAFLGSKIYNAMSGYGEFAQGLSLCAGSIAAGVAGALTHAGVRGFIKGSASALTHYRQMHPKAETKPAAIEKTPKAKKAPRLRKAVKAADPTASIMPEVLVLSMQMIIGLFGKPEEETVKARMKDALINDHPKALRRAIEAGAPLDDRIEMEDGFKGSAAAYCADKGSLKCLMTLKRLGAEMDNSVDGENTTLRRAIMKDRHDAALIAVDGGAKITPEDIALATNLGRKSMLNKILTPYGELAGTAGAWAELTPETTLKQRVAPQFGVAAVRVQAEEECAPASSQRGARMEMKA